VGGLCTGRVSLHRYPEPDGSVRDGAVHVGPGRGQWDLSWRGWWGEEPPYHAPVYVLSHYAREPLPMEGGTTFHFVTDGMEAALEQARRAVARVLCT
jgi:hypothetical protein